MRKALLTVAGLGLTLGLAACSDSTEPDTTDAESSPEQTEETTAASPEAQACEDFFGGNVPLAERAETDREALTAGEITDATTYAEINGLESRISSVVDSAPDEIATLLEQVNAPFSEAVDQVNSFEAPEDAEEGPTFPDLSTIDVAGSESAQEELDSLCADA